MQEYQQFPLGNPRDVSDLMDDEIIRCDTCGATGFDKDLVLCHKCREGAEHTYCMHPDEQSELEAKPEICKDWTCQECMPRESTNKFVQDEVEVSGIRKKGHLFDSSTDCESSEGSKLKSRSSSTGISGESGAELSAERLQVPVKRLKLKSVNRMVFSVPERSSGGTLFSGPSAVENGEQLDHRLLASNHNTHKDPNCPNGKNESQQGEQPTKAATSMSMDELCTDPASDERTYLRDLDQVEAAYLSHHIVIPKADHQWLGKFQIHNSEGIARTWDRIQAHLSNCVAVEVVEVAKRLSEIIILEELPRLRTWPSQFVRSQVTEENIALYFFAQNSDSYMYYEQLMNYMMNNDLALKANLDGVELLIFPSNILPENSQCWNGMFFFWGVFRGRKLKNGDGAKPLPFDLNAYPQDGDDMALVDENPEFEASGDTVLVVGENSNNVESAGIIDINVSLWPENERQENSSVGIEDNNVEAPSTSSLPSTFLNSSELECADALLLLANGEPRVPHS